MTRVFKTSTVAAGLATLPLLLACGQTVDLKADRDGLLLAARGLVHVECPAASSCAAAPVGAKACGGPREFWTYCRSTTNEAALLAKIEEARQVEVRYNELTHAVSDCAQMLPPQAFAITNGQCRVAVIVPVPGAAQ
jgi:hypothetical protein